MYTSQEGKKNDGQRTSLDVAETDLSYELLPAKCGGLSYDFYF